MVERDIYILLIKLLFVSKSLSWVIKKLYIYLFNALGKIYINILQGVHKQENVLRGALPREF